MRRRTFLALSAVPLACGGEADMSWRSPLPFGQGGLAPWHMWGTSAVVTVPNIGLAIAPSTQQLARINYKRPETWSFLFAAELLQAPTVLVNLVVLVEFELIVGIGRSVLKISSNDDVSAPTGNVNQGFVRFAWVIPGGGVPAPAAQLKWTTVATTPPLDETLATPVQQTLDSFPAQDIQVSARVRAVSASEALADPVTILNIHAYFAPRSHVRPDWFRDGPDALSFRGGETDGT